MGLRHENVTFIYINYDDQAATEATLSILYAAICHDIPYIKKFHYIMINSLESA